MKTENENQAKNPNQPPTSNVSRRDALKSLGAVATGLAAAAAAPAALAADAPAAYDPFKVTSPYGGGPGAGISLPPYYKPTESVKNNNVYYPGTEELGKD